MGANVKGAGTEKLVIKGVKSLHGTQHAVVQDRIEAGTFMVAAAMTSGNVLIKDAIWEHNRPLISKCWKRFSKTVSLMLDLPFTTAIRAVN